MDPADYYAEVRSHGVGAVEMVPEERFGAARAAGLEILNLAGPGMMQGLNRRENHATLLPEILSAARIASEHAVPAVIVFSGNRAEQPDSEGLAQVAEGLEQILPEVESLGVALWFEMLCARDHPDYQADRSAYGFELHGRVDSPALRILYDVYHMSQMGEDVSADLSTELDRVAHIHLADLPKRGCPSSDERIAFRSLLSQVVSAGYAGWFGLEFLPAGRPLDDLGRAVAHVSS
jgi:hydroxypyruvate isomerase